MFTLEQRREEKKQESSSKIIWATNQKNLNVMTRSMVSRLNTIDTRLD
ncbi:MAG: hypothetical protein KME32_21335 [Mojavia pulchra JT2-VF2]|uniref:Uncharacterized protein n=1 Tax=Mojavia pulchra JT2-VF2 TaxID=287848 RepID=A0A951Q374_9NOST|nr:hypothetical protein [Mojavia pulchra JT2-VF2]